MFLTGTGEGMKNENNLGKKIEISLFETVTERGGKRKRQRELSVAGWVAPHQNQELEALKWQEPKDLDHLLLFLPGH